MKSKLPEGWEEVRLGDIVEIHNSKRIPLSSRERAKLKKKYRYYGAQGIIDYVDDYIFDGRYVLVAEDGENLRSRKKNIAALVEGKFWVNNHAHILTQNSYSDLRFLYYSVNSLDIEAYLTGSVQPKLNRRNIESMRLNLPSLKEQKVIADTLSALDDKIENNNRVNENLEQQAQEIFKHWFVNFEFPDKNGMPYKSSGGEMIESKIGLIPDGWEVKSLIEIAEFLNGVAIAKHKPTKGTEDSLPAVKIRELRQGYTDQSSDQCLTSVDEKYIIDDFDMIFSWSGSLLIDIWVGDKAILNQHLFKVTSEEHDQWYYYYWTKHFLDEFIQIAQSKATTMGHINRSHLAEAKVLLPDASTYKEMGKTLGGILNLKMKNQKQNQKLSELRDTLLPKLMSGELRIPFN